MNSGETLQSAEQLIGAYHRGTLSLEQLVDQLGRWAEQNQQRAPDVLALLESEMHSGRLATEAFHALAKVLNVYEPTRIGGAPERDEATRIIAKTGHAPAPPEPQVAAPSPAPEPAPTPAAATPTPSELPSGTPSETPSYQPPAHLPLDEEHLGPGSVVKHRFVLEKIMGVGGMSVVFKARDLRKEEAQDKNPFVAMKVLGGAFKAHPDSFITLQREAKKAQSLAHPNIVTVYDFDRDGDTIYMTMEALAGQPLDKRISAKPVGMKLSDALPIIEGMSQALAYAHKKNIIHSDFKPGNVFCTKDGSVKVLDFGIARAKATAEESAAEADAFDAGSLGALTPAYASCEMIEGGEPDPRDDIYALACITYELLTGRHPFNKTPATEARDNGAVVPRIEGLSRRQWNALKRGLAFDRKERTPDVLTFLTGIKPKVYTKGEITAVAVIVILIGASGYFGYQAIFGEPPRIELTEEQKLQVAELMERAHLYLQLGHLATPPGDSAFDAFEQVLEIDPGNPEAIAGKQAIADRYAEQATAAYDERNFELARMLTDTGLRVDEENNALQELRDKLADVPAVSDR